MAWLWQDFHTASIFSVLLTCLFYLIRVIAFFVTSFTFYKLAIKHAIPNPWMAFVPVIRYYLLGQLIGETLPVTERWHIPFIQYLLPFLAAFMVLLSGTFAGKLASFLTSVLVVLCYCSLFRRYREEYALLYGLMAGLPYLEIIGCFLLLRLVSLPLPDPKEDATVFRSRR
ncbi:MAG: hypothetical protein KBG64_02895 [Clostridia bacterium]|nr:hypothetical protein [Clostridia bacterium]